MSEYTPPPDSGQPPPVNPYDSPETVRPGMSSGAKVLIGLGIGCGVLALLCCGVLGFSAFFFGRSFQQAKSKDPATIRRVTESIVTIDVPVELPPEASVDWDIPLVGQMSMAIYGDQQDRNNLVLFQIAKDVIDPETLRAQFDQALEQSGGNKMEDVELEMPETFETEINGEPAKFTVAQGVENRAERAVLQATGAFKGKGGAAMLFLRVSAEDFDKEQVMAVLKSMH